MLGVVVGDAGGAGGVLGGVGGGLGGCGEAAFDFADAVEVFVELAAVGRAEAVAEATSVFANVVEDGLAVSAALGGGVGVGWIDVAEEAVENEAGVDFLGEGSGFGAPGNVGGIGAAIAGVAVAGLGGGVAAEFERGEAGEVADFPGGDLVDGDASLDVGTVGFTGVAAGEECGEGAGVVAAAVALGVGVVLGKAG